MMKFNIGDKVKFLNTKGGGIVSKIISPTLVNVMIEDGFEIPTITSEIIKVDQQGKVASMFDEEFPVGSRQSSVVSQQSSVVSRQSSVSSRQSSVVSQQSPETRNLKRETRNQKLQNVKRRSVIIPSVLKTPRASTWLSFRTIR